MKTTREFKNTIIWAKSTNSGGKSTVPHYMLENSNDEEIEYIYDEGEKPKIIATIFKKFHLASVGPYVKGKTFGGRDSLVKSQILEALDKLSALPYDVYVEGIMTSDTKGTGKPKSGEAYYDILKKYPRNRKRYMFIDIKWETVLERIKARTGKTDEEILALKNVKNKYDSLPGHLSDYLSLGEIETALIDNNGTKEEFIENFLMNF